MFKKCCLQSKKMQWTDPGAAILKYNLQIRRNVSDFIYMKQTKQLHQNKSGNVKKWSYISECLTFCDRRQEGGREIKSKENLPLVILFCFLKNAGHSFNIQIKNPPKITYFKNIFKNIFCLYSWNTMFSCN